MKILVVGAGLTGCSAARLLSDRGHDVSIIEEQGRIGGLCVTNTSPNGIRYEPYGARTFHTDRDRVRRFVQGFDDFNGYVHRKGIMIDGELFAFPIAKSELSRLPHADRIAAELAARSGEIDPTNFETACVSLFGPTLYGLIVENYSRKMWGVCPTDLTAEWAPRRLELRKDDRDGLFRGEWQGLPRGGYSQFLERMVDGIPVGLNDSAFEVDRYDLVISCARIDRLMGYRFGRLQYRSLEFDYVADESWEEERYGTINLPQHPTFFRKCNFKVLHKQESKHNWIQYQRAVPADESNMPMYPVENDRNQQLFDSYLRAACDTPVLPAGRLGLFKYLDMDDAVESAFLVAALAESYPSLSVPARLEAISEIRASV
ncbi:MAG: UDP-galactopyranose mutase [Kiritimatiellia bacterium]|jgi:UDP-galactopyranose mutase|nr:UDP-galactopyranose mutase [Kiritimatiellia bacterium]MDP6631207.1 UDP-galactopyranose mutase [Kiritimatiellia bacterium]MDP6811439.1 UDP-galactopyranose mutase [Kiritimatiellia bacterium]MDP7024501.1 UDP-galactopyranose mutase [Kiritimatiellia bacterium]